MRTVLPTQEQLDEFSDKLDSLLQEVPVNWRAEWAQHPLTKIFKERLELDLAQVTLLWLLGAYSDEQNPEVGRVKSEHARGKALAIEDVLEYLTGMCTTENQETKE